MLIIWDIDDVLNDLMFTWLQEWQREHKGFRKSYSELKENPPDKLLNISRTDYYNSLDRFRNSNKAKELKPNPLILNWFRKNGTKHEHLALTARPLTTMSNQAEWLYRYFGQWIHTLSVVPGQRDPEKRQRFKNKAEYIKWLGKGDIFVDDNNENINAVNNLGLKTVLYPQPWNSSTKTEEETIMQLSGSRPQ